MEYKLNKVDPEVRQRVNAITKSGKVHTKKSIVINDDHKKDKKEENKYNFEEELKKQRPRGKVIEVDAVSTAEGEALKDDKLVGTILDIRK